MTQQKFTELAERYSKVTQMKRLAIDGYSIYKDDKIRVDAVVCECMEAEKEILLEVDALAHAEMVEVGC